MLTHRKLQIKSLFSATLVSPILKLRLKYLALVSCPTSRASPRSSSLFHQKPLLLLMVSVPLALRKSDSMSGISTLSLLLPKRLWAFLLASALLQLASMLWKSSRLASHPLLLTILAGANGCLVIIFLKCC